MARASKDPLAALRAGSPAPIYLVDGDERLLVDEAVAEIKAASLPETARDFNFDLFSGKEANPDRIAEAAQMFPAFAKRRLVMVTHADKLASDDAAALMRYAADPSPTTVLLLVATKFDARTKVYKALKKAGVALRFSHPKPREMADIIKRRAERIGAKIDSRAIRALIDAVGADASAAYQALELLALYVGDSSRAITADDIAHVVAVTKEESIFKLVDAIGQRDRRSVLLGLHSMLSSTHEHPLRILAMIARHYRNLLRARVGLDRKASRSELQSMVGVPPFLLNNLLSQARDHRVEDLARGLTRIQATDGALKGGGLADARAIERLALSLMQQA